MAKNYKPKGYWTKERCAEEALKYDTRTAFAKGSGSAYNAAKREGWLDDVCGHMTSTKKPKGYWTKERCAEAALKYETRNAFAKESISAYCTAHQEGWLDDICGHMDWGRKPDRYWDFKNCLKEAQKYPTRGRFCKSSGAAYNVALRNNWLDDICGHMTSPQKLSGYWTKERCAKAALQYETRTAFRKGSGGAYVAAQKNKWLDEICTHMEFTCEAIRATSEYSREEYIQARNRHGDHTIDFMKNDIEIYWYGYQKGWNKE